MIFDKRYILINEENEKKIIKALKEHGIYADVNNCKEEKNYTLYIDGEKVMYNYDRNPKNYKILSLEEIKNRLPLDRKFEKLYELLKEWYDLGLSNRKFSELGIKYDGGEYEVCIKELGAYEYGATIDIALDKHIKELEEDKDYIEYKADHLKVIGGVENEYL